MAARAAWSTRHRRRLAAVGRELDGLAHLGRAAACATLLARWQRLAPATTACYVRTLKALLYYRRRPEQVVFRAAMRTSGAAPVPLEAPPVGELLETLRVTSGPNSDAVLLAAVAGGARFSSVRALRVGDVNEYFVILRQLKTGRAQAPEFFPMPRDGWVRDRLRGYWADEPRGVGWGSRPLLLPREVTPGRMAAVIPPRVLRRAVACFMTARAGTSAAAQCLANTPATVRHHYCPAATDGAAVWGLYLSSQCRPRS